MEGTELTLRWEKFGLSRGLHEMLATKDLVDVTIACQGEYMQAHKTVLAACSSQFRKIFLANPCQHPVIFMQDSKLSHLQAVLNFMYTGEATVLQHELAGFMKTAEALKVSGLTTPAQGPGPVLHQKKPDAGVPPPKKTRTSQAQPWVNLHGMKMETPGVYIVEPGQLQASVNMDTTEISETERAVESVEAQEQVEEDQDDDHYAGGGDDDDGDPDWFDESAKEHDEGNTSQPSTSAGVSSRDVRAFLEELEGKLNETKSKFALNGKDLPQTADVQCQNEISPTAQQQKERGTKRMKASQSPSPRQSQRISRDHKRKTNDKTNKNTQQQETNGDTSEEMDSDDLEYEPPTSPRKIMNAPTLKCLSQKRKERVYSNTYNRDTWQYQGPCKCDFCGKIYKNFHSLRGHVKKLHPEHPRERVPSHLCSLTYRRGSAEFK